MKWQQICGIPEMDVTCGYVLSRRSADHPFFWDAFLTRNILERMDRDEQTYLGWRSKAINIPRVIVSFSGYEPPFDVSSTVQRLLDSIPKEFLTGLSAVVLTNKGTLSRKRRNSIIKTRQRKMRLNAAAGLYHPAAKGNLAWIEIFVDTTVRGWDKTFWVRVPYFRESKLADVLFHEVGHHIHCTVRPEHREKEDVADVWKVRLQRNYHKQRFAWLRIVSRIIQPVLGSFLERQREKVELKMLRNGQISQTEYRESVRKKRPGNTGQ